MSKAKKWILAIMMLLIFCIGAYEWLLPYAATGLIKRWCRKSLNSEFSFESLEFKNFHWVIYKPCLAKENQTAAWFTAKALEIQWNSFNSPLIVVDSAKIFSCNTEPALNNVLNKSLSKKKPSLFSFRPKILFQNCSFSAENQTHYNFDGWYSENQRPSFSFQFFNLEEKVSCEYERGKFSFLFNKGNLSSIAELLHFTGKLDKSFLVAAGELNGTITLSLQKNGSFTPLGEVTCENLYIKKGSDRSNITAAISTLKIWCDSKKGNAFLPDGAEIVLGKNHYKVSTLIAPFSWENNIFVSSVSSQILFGGQQEPFYAYFLIASTNDQQREISLGINIVDKLSSSFTSPVSGLWKGFVSIKHLFAATFLPAKQKQIFALFNSNIKHFDLEFLVNSNNAPSQMEGKISCAENSFPFSLENSFDGLAVKKGEISGRVALEKILNSTAILDNSFAIEGLTTFKAQFDEKQGQIFYSLEHLKIENSEYSLYFPWVGGDKENKAYYQLDFNKDVSQGSIAFLNGFFKKKNSPLALRDLQGEIEIENNHIFSKKLEGFCHEIYLGGKLDGTFAGKSNYQLEIDCDTVQGQIKQFATEIKDYLPLPDEGIISAKNPGLLFNFTCKNGQKDFHTEASFHLTEGKLGKLKDLCAVDQLSCDIAYNSKQNSLFITEIQGTVLPKLSLKKEEFFLGGNTIHSKALDSGKFFFDLWLTDRENEILRVGGSLAADYNDQSFRVDFDTKLTHVAGLYPKNFFLQFNKPFELKKLKFSLRANFMNGIGDLHFLEELKFFSKPLVSLVKKNLFGEWDLFFDYEAAMEKLSFEAKGEKVRWANRTFKNSFIRGEKIFNEWSIEQAVFDDLTFSTQFHHTPSCWKIDFLGIRYGDNFLLGAEGVFFPKTQTVDAKINLLEAELHGLKNYSFYPLQGRVTAKGECSFSDLTAPHCTKAKLSAVAENISLGEIKIGDKEDLLLEVDKGLINITTPKATKIVAGNSSGEINLENFCLYSASHTLKEIKGSFSLPLPVINSLNRVLFNDTKTASIISKLNVAEPVKGIFALENSSLGYKTIFTLENLNLLLKNRELQIVAPTFAFERNGIKASFGYGLEEQMLNCHVAMEPYPCPSGRLTIDPKDSQGDLLAVNWEESLGKSTYIKSIEGSLFGITSRLKRSDKKELLSGTIAIESDKITKYFSKIFNATYSLPAFSLISGKWRYDRIKGILFEGFISGYELKLKEFFIKQLNFALKYFDKTFLLNDVSLKERHGAAKAKHIKIYKEKKGSWKFFIPELSAKNVILHYSNFLFPTKKKSKISFDNLNLTDVTGAFFSPPTWEASGFVGFTNNNKNISLFEIPKELANHGDLTKAMLTPLRGQIDFIVHDNKIIFKNFNEIFNYGKSVQFSLVAPEESFIDFSGNINMKIGLRRSSALFNTVENFILSVSGTLQKPKSSLIKIKSKP